MSRDFFEGRQGAAQGRGEQVALVGGEHIRLPAQSSVAAQVLHQGLGPVSSLEPGLGRLLGPDLCKLAAAGASQKASRGRRHG